MEWGIVITGLYVSGAVSVSVLVAGVWPDAPTSVQLARDAQEVPVESREFKKVV